ncbi:TDT family transporter [Streptomyces sp. NPDC059176]|uniref:TDT family transporter n=1 Tax=unclassified Streptomyces TaxID=2593676 RepID=UPI0036B2BB03
MVTAVRPRPAAALRRPSLRDLGPNWYATVMGTAIVATAGSALPGQPPGLRTVCTAVWVLSAMMLTVLVTARAAHWIHHRDQARAHVLDPSVAPFYGCLSMAFLAVGIGALALGGDLVGEQWATVAGAALFAIGTATGLAAAVAVPYLMITHHSVARGTASPVWLLPVVAPMVAATLGAQLVPRLPAGQWREAMLLACYAMFGLSLLAVLLILPVLFGRLLHHGPLPLALTPTLFLVLGPLGQSTTAVNRLADVAPSAVQASYATGFAVFAVVYGVPVLGFALLWLTLAGVMVGRAARKGMPFSMTWWAFTFPVGTCVTASAGLAAHTGLVALEWLAFALYALLVTAWIAAATGTLRGLLNGELLAAPGAPRPATARTR